MDTHFTVYVYICPALCIDCNSLSSTAGKRVKAVETEQGLEKEQEKTEEDERSSGCQGSRKKKEGKEVIKEMCQETQEDGRKALIEKPEAKRGGRKRKEENETEEAEKRKKTKQDEETESKKEVEMERRRITESEEKKETKQRQGMRGVRGRRGRGPGTRTREWIGSTEKQEVTKVTERTVGKKRGWKRKAKGAPGEEAETEMRNEDEEEEGRKASQANVKDIKKKRENAAEDEKEQDIQIDDNRLETEMSKKKESPLVDNEVKSSFTLRSYLVQNNFKNKMSMNIFLWLNCSLCKCAAAAPPGS